MKLLLMALVLIFSVMSIAPGNNIDVMAQEVAPSDVGHSPIVRCDLPSLSAVDKARWIEQCAQVTLVVINA